MCLLFTRPANSPALSDEWLTDFWTHNRDGFGVMYAEEGILRIAKGIGSVSDWIEFFRRHDAMGVDCVYHLRMKTHGHIDLTNCHPYEVYGDGAQMPVYMMHNGVLHTGNDKDKSKSDTWHFIRDYLIPLTKAEPELVFTPEFEAVMGKFIGNNRFAFMNHLGQTQIVNRAQGVEWKGMWMSNTYAWDYYKAFPEKRVASWSNYGTSSWEKTKQVSKVTKAPKTKQKPAGKVVPMPAKVFKHEDDIAVAMDDIMVRSLPVSEKVTLSQLERLFNEFGSHDAWRWIEAFSYSVGKESEEKFLAGMRDPRKVKDWLNHMDNTASMDYIL